MTKMSDLSNDLKAEILSRTPRTSLVAVRSTCKLWEALSKHRILCKKEAKHQSVGFAMLDEGLFSIRFNRDGIHNGDGKKFDGLSIKPIGKSLNAKVGISNVFYCDGLLLCFTGNYYSRMLLVWNPYLGQTKWIELSKDNDRNPMDATYALGYDNNKNHKILKFYEESDYEIYDLKSGSWRSANVIANSGSKCYQPGASINGNAYFLSDAREVAWKCNDCLICFDFTTERFGEPLSLPFSKDFESSGRLSCVKEEKLAAAYQSYEECMIEIWVTTKIESSEVSWTKFLKVEMEPLIGLLNNDKVDSFFIDEEKKVAVVFYVDEFQSHPTAFIVGDRCLKEVDLRKAMKSNKSYSFSKLVCSCSNYVPSLVQLN